MRITDVLIEDYIKEKILNKHGITAKEIKEALLTNPYVLKTRDSRYIAIGFYQRYITIVFENVRSIAFIITSYQSSEAQIRLYKTKRK